VSSTSTGRGSSIASLLCTSAFSQVSAFGATTSLPSQSG
jgi:hypothetical protein